MNDIIELFVQSWKPTLAAWTSFLREAMIPSSVSVASPDVSMAVKALNGVIAGGGGTYLPSRFGNVQLLRFFTALKQNTEGQEKWVGSVRKQPRQF